jgi:membrane protein DedA with SNARE-associated domain
MPCRPRVPCEKGFVISFRTLLLQHGYALLIGYVFAGAAGSPTPIDPMLLVMGALVGNHEYSFLPAFAGALAACLLGDQIWYQLGRRKGRSVLDVLCKLSLEPDNCVRKTEDTFGKRGPLALLFVKFLPGLSLVSIALAGVTKMPLWKFLLLDAAGSSMWAGSYLCLGVLCHRQVDEVILWLGLFGQRAGLTVVVLLALYIGAKYTQRRLLLRQLRINRISPHDVYDGLMSGEPMTIVDLRNSAEVERSGLKIAGATVINPSELRARASEIPLGRDVVLYCT